MHNQVLVKKEPSLYPNKLLYWGTLIFLLLEGFLLGMKQDILVHKVKFLFPLPFLSTYES